MNLYKHHPKNPYLFWAIMSIVLQVSLLFLLLECFLIFTADFVVVLYLSGLILASFINSVFRF